MDENPYEPPREAPSDTNPIRRRPSILQVMGGVVVACFLLAFGGFFVTLMLGFAIASLTYPAGAERQRAIAELAGSFVLPTFLAAALGVGWASHSAIAPVRIAAWAIAGLGLGVVVSRIAGIPHDFVLVPPILFGLAFSIVGYLSPLRHPVRDRRAAEK